MTLSLIAALAMSATIPLNTTITARQAFAYEFETHDNDTVGILAGTSPQVRVPITGSVDLETGRWQIDPFSMTIPAVTATKTLDVEVTIPHQPRQEICDANGCVIIPEQERRQEIRQFNATVEMLEYDVDFREIFGSISRYRLNDATLRVEQSAGGPAAVEISIQGPETNRDYRYTGSGVSPNVMFRTMRIERDDSGQVIGASLDPLRYEILINPRSGLSCHDRWCGDIKLVPEPSAAALLTSVPLGLCWLRRSRRARISSSSRPTSTR